MNLDVASASPKESSEAPRQRWWSFVLQLLRGMALPFLVALVALAVRLVYLTPIENDGDAIRKWFMVKQVLHGVTPEWNHHAARLAIGVPVYLAQAVLGTNAPVYYVMPVTMGVAMALVTFGLGKRIGGVATGTIAAILVIAFPEMERAGSQLLPGGFCAVFIGLSTWGVVRHANRPNRWWLVFAGVSLFFGYMSRVTVLFALPGLVIGTWLTRRRLMDAVVFLAPLVLLFGLELAVYNLFTDFTYGRISVIQSSHGTKGRFDVGLKLAKRRYSQASWYWTLCIYALVPALPGLLALSRRRANQVVALTALSTILLLTFPVRDFSARSALSHHERYFVDGLVLMLVVHAAFAVAVLRHWASTANRGMFGAVLRLLARRSNWCMAALVLGYGVVSVIAGGGIGKEHTLARLRDETRLVAMAYEQDVPIISPAAHRKALDVVRYVLLPDEWLLDKQGRLNPLKVASTRVRGKRYRYLARDLSSRQVRARIEKRCYVELRRVAGQRHSRHSEVVFEATGKRCWKRPP